MERRERIGPYEIIGRIGRGGSADILLALAADGRTRVAIKRLHDHLAEDEIFVRMFLDEARVMSLLPHENIVRVFDLGEHEGTCYTAMELVDGPPLSAVMKLVGAPLAPDVVAAVGAHVAEALAFVHDARDPATHVPLELVHRDVAAPNILVSRTGDVKLTDFGVVRSRTAKSLGILSSETTKGGVLKGRKSTMSPEQVLGKAIDKRADLFSLGVVLWECAMGRRLWDTSSATSGALDIVDQIVNAPAPSLHGAPQELAALVAQLLEKDRERRPPSARDVAARLQPLAAPHGTIAALIQSLGIPSLR